MGMSSFKDNDKRGNSLNYFTVIKITAKIHKGHLFHYIDVAKNAISHLIIVLHHESNKTP